MQYHSENQKNQSVFIEYSFNIRKTEGKWYYKFMKFSFTSLIINMETGKLLINIKYLKIGCDNELEHIILKEGKSGIYINFTTKNGNWNRTQVPGKMWNQTSGCQGDKDWSILPFYRFP